MAGLLWSGSLPMAPSFFLSRKVEGFKFPAFRPHHRHGHHALRLRPATCYIYDKKTIDSLTNFSNTLANHVFSDSNVVFSPVSIYFALSLLAAGSSGPTLHQMLSFLKSEPSRSPIYKIFYTFYYLRSRIFAEARVQNGVWVDQTLSIQPSFQGDMKPDSYQLDFQTKAVEVTNDVNSWAENQTNTNGLLIKEILPSDARFIYATAVHFKGGTWMNKFDRSKDAQFHLVDGSKVQVPFMTSSRKRKQFVGCYDGFKVLRLPYSPGPHGRHYGTCLSMYLFLPDAKHGLPSLLHKFCSASGSDFLDRHIPDKRVQLGDFMIPKFKISFGFEASDMMKELGLVLPFSCGYGGLVEGGNLFLSTIHNKSFVEVDDQGTQAGATSAAVLTVNEQPTTASAALTSMIHDDDQHEAVDFVADHPFVFLITGDKTGVVVFMGQLLDPRS